MKRMEVTEKTIGDSTFYIKPFGAFTATNISGELTAVLSPLLTGLTPLINASAESDGGESQNLMDMDVEKAMPPISSALSTLSGDKIERLVKRLLVEHRNVSVVNNDVTGGDAKLLTMDLADEIFCGEIQNMFALCIAVIKVNFNGFFKNVGIQSGSLIDRLNQGTPTSENGETSTSVASAILS